MRALLDHGVSWRIVESQLQRQDASSRRVRGRRNRPVFCTAI